ncbi:hypothetical protein [Botrimarina mediterranea]|uniref:Uncharacterized protein n=1 Tax=Botrimarina mediterranea TaxID=2528022 RepID=A0A518K780_9BACT|nr:hypothetical protein [Botrimarina mediterranea]QDV73648.1 hypothetical protein Spa11_18470 [Botrimarina mediterranea]QDV78238.1 hypothetical protein K2D_18450 [Planctomycetes bacterium K2D]
MSWTSAIDLKHWADTLASRGELPLLLRRLVRSTVPDDATVLFPAGEQIGRPGFDGVVVTSRGNQFVPTGKSCWEAGVNKGCAQKAKEDFDSRTASESAETRRESIFVFVTPREWRKKDEWAEQQELSTDWKGVVALDANDLEHWLETLPHVDAWFSHQTGSRPEGVLDLSLRWKALREVADHPLLPEVFITSRESAVTELREWVASPPGSLLLRSSSVEEGLDFLCAAVGSHADAAEAGFERLVVIDEVSAWRRLAASHRPLILTASVAAPLSAEDVAGAIASGHHVLIIAASRGGTANREMVLPRQDAYAVEQELLQCGFDASTAAALARSAGGSTTIFKRLAAKHPFSTIPGWAGGEVRERLAPFALLGGWRHTTAEPPVEPLFPIHLPLDVDCVCDLAGVSREQLDELLVRWTDCDDALFLRFGESVVLASREDAWHRLGPLITPSVLGRFEELASLVLSEDNPAFELPEKDWWLANLYGKTTSLSAGFRRGIVESLALMATIPTSNQTTNPDFSTIIRGVLVKSLPEGSSWRRWATFDRQLEVIAEADPEFLLSRLEGDLRSAEPEVPKLLVQRSDGVFPTWTHCGLLWALEILAWEPAYLERVTKILCLLAEREQEIPGNYSNRPSNSLREVFLSWNPQTNATTEQKLAVLRRARVAHQDVIWRFLVSQLPDGIDSTSHPTARPKWRNWAAGWSQERNQSNWREYAFSLIDLLIEEAGLVPERWAQVLNGVFRCGDSVTERALSTLDRIADSGTEVDPSGRLWTAMGRIVRSHRSFAEADWAYPEAILSRVEDVGSRIEPSDPVVRHQWLFDRHVELPGFSGVGSDHSEYEHELSQKQKQALREIVQEAGWLGVERLIANVERVHGIGWTVGENQLLKPTDFNLIGALTSDDENRRVFSHDYIFSSVSFAGLAFLDSLELGTMDPAHAAALACAAPYQRSTWDWIDQHLSPQIADLYWNKCRGWAMQMPQDDVSFAVERLLEAKRAFSASSHVHQASHNNPIDAETAARVLEAGFVRDANVEPVDQIDSYAIQELIGELQKQDAFDQARLAKIEYGYLPLLDRHTSRTQPKTLFAELSKNPQLYIELLTLVYRSDEDDAAEERLDENAVAQAKRAHDLLDAFKTIPGTGEDDAIDEAALQAWVDEARRLAAQVHRADIADRNIGHLLANYPSNDLQAWPPQEICRVIESIATMPLRESFVIGVINSKGVCFKPQEGGDPLRRKAESYRLRASSLQADYPNVADILRDLAAHSEATAERDDSDAARRRLGR